MNLEKEVTIQSYDGVSLSGTLTIPEDPKMIFIPLHGSFVQTRDGDLDGNAKWLFPHGTPKRRLFADMGDRLISLGIGSFRYDKRASGKSGGTYLDADLIALAWDATSVLKEVQKLYPNVPIGFVGQSEGGLVSVKAVELGADPSFILLQAPLLEPIGPFLDFQKTNAAAPFLNDTTGELAKRLPYLSAFYEAMYNGDMYDQLTGTNNKHYLLKGTDGWEAMTSLEKYRQYGWNGLELLKKVQVPVRIIIADQDKNVSLRPIQTLLQQQATNNDFDNVSVEILAGLEHSFRKVEANESFVQVMAKPVAEDYLLALENAFHALGQALELPIRTKQLRE